jgi:Zn-dependent protease with chaperone function
VCLSNGNGTLNAFAAQSGWTNNYVVLSNELFANLRNDNREGTRFNLGHEIGHIRLHHYHIPRRGWGADQTDLRPASFHM